MGPPTDSERLAKTAEANYMIDADLLWFFHDPRPLVLQKFIYQHMQKMLERTVTWCTLCVSAPFDSKPIVDPEAQAHFFAYMGGSKIAFATRFYMEPIYSRYPGIKDKWTV